MSARRRVRSPSTTVDKWQLVENVVAALERIRSNVPGTRIVPKALLPVLADPQDHREIDVYLEVPVGDRTIQVGVEVKERSTRRFDTAQLGSLLDLKKEVGLHYLCVVCTSGFTQAAKRKADRSNVQLVEPDQVDDSGFFPGEDVAFIFEKGATPLHTLVVFDPATPRAEVEAINAVLVGGNTNDLVLIEREGAEIPIHLVTAAEGSRAASMLDPPPVDGERFQATIVGISSRFVSLKRDNHRLPAPASLVVDYEFVHRPTKHFKFRLFGFDVVAFVEQTPAGPMQVTMIAIPAPEAPGTFRISFQRYPLSPPKTVIEHKGSTADAPREPPPRSASPRVRTAHKKGKK